MTKPFQALLFFSIMWACAGLANAETPDQEKCTCDTEVEGEPNNGAWVKNATSCWSTEIEDRQWCDITVETLEGSQAQAAVTMELLDRKDDPAALNATLQRKFQEFAATAADVPTGVNIGIARDTVPAALTENQALMVQCVNAFREGKRGAVFEGEKGFRCSVGEFSGWLRLEFQLGDFLLAYIIAPSS